MSLVKSLDQLEYEVYNPRNRMKEIPGLDIVLQKGMISDTQDIKTVSLSGDWELVQDGDADRVYEANWEGSIPAKVPGSVHAALLEAGVIPDPITEKNDGYAREKSRHYWWYRKKFSRPQGMKRVLLEFGGICDRCTIWLNGRLLGSHQGMFGGPEYEITDLLEDENTLIVMLYPAPYRVGREYQELNPFFNQMNIGWTDTTVFNCVYGWHYANIPALGIWMPVSLKEIPDIEIADPFIHTVDIAGNMELYLELHGPEGGFQGELELCIKPFNFQGDCCAASLPVTALSMRHKMRLDFRIPDVRLWWPNDLGSQCLYQLELHFKAHGYTVNSVRKNFGVRTIEMRPYLGQPAEDRYNWQFAINGEEIFVKGANWCTLDFGMRFTEERYDRFLSLARNQHLQILRAWGGGMPETDTFYDLCDQYGIMVLQEFATAWDSQKHQPADVLREGVERSIVRIRNHPSLIMWCGGNESEHPTDAVIDMMGRMVYELDGTRPFHRNDPWGGSSHNYDVYWGQKDFDVNLAYKAPFIGEFGFASSPSRESVEKYCTEEDFRVWPPVPDGNVEYHTPVFNKNNDMNILHRYIPEFLPDTSIDNMIVSTQICQATAVRHTLEVARCRRPEATGICYYKLTDVFPAVSWSTIDWFGVPKCAYYFIQDSYEPLHACVLFDTLQPKGNQKSLPVYIIDDDQSLENKRWRVVCRAFNGQLEMENSKEWTGVGEIGHNKKIGEFLLTEKAAASVPLFIVVELEKEGERVGRTFYWLNFSEKSGCIFQIPKCQLSLVKQDGKAILVNEGTVPAVGVHFDCKNVSDKFTAEDSYVWLDSGETMEIGVNMDEYENSAWNS